ncbi:hypothetical protein HMI54_001745 [Coelomomyces lativittatus]|nr:hypothetical protein HMI55_000396 [Coelomomyces lativittatus]KAJ1510276.1 hypothetical protein HMI54_001745 [Coelomomyces lativittatus]KAJ1514676.1 hypothetical protein HMI56_007670 [Coelomomyces lativittatus]
MNALRKAIPFSKHPFQPSSPLFFGKRTGPTDVLRSRSLLRRASSTFNEANHEKTPFRSFSLLLTDILLYATSGVLIAGSLYYASNALEKLYLETTYGDHSNEVQTQSTSKPITLQTGLLHLFLNWWIYPKEVRKPLRAALLHDTIAPFADSPKQAEAFYLLAYDAGLKKQVDLRMLSGIAYQLAQFYETHSVSTPSTLFTWYQHALTHLIGWHLTHLSSSPSASSSSSSSSSTSSTTTTAGVTVPELETLVSLLDASARHAPTSTETETLYSMALSLCFTPTHPSLTTYPNLRLDPTQVKLRLEQILNQKVPPFPSPPLQPSVSSSTLLHLLEHFASFYDSQAHHLYAIQLRHLLLTTLPMPPPTTKKNDPLCRRALVLNNLASNHLHLGTEPHLVKAKHFLLTAEHEPWLDTKECQECYFVVSNNLGKVAEKVQAMEAAKLYYERALALARKVGEVEKRRDVQASLARVNAFLKTPS